jgi:hypothetical protein
MRPVRPLQVLALRALACGALGAPLVVGCDAREAHVVLDDRYPPATALVVYQAFWQNVRFTEPVAPGSSSDSQKANAASDNTAWVVLAPVWDPASSSMPAQKIVLQSRQGFTVHLDQTLHIPVDDADFAGNCGAGSMLDQDDADFITQRVFADLFAGVHYDAATCTTTSTP